MEDQVSFVGWEKDSHLLSYPIHSELQHVYLPKKVGENLDSMSRRFWWNSKKSEEKFLAWRSWDKLCYPKSQGGLGFKKAKDINTALLAKLAWMIASKRDSLCMNILRAKYRVSEDWLHSEPPNRASPIWRAIELAKKVIVKGTCYTIGNGASINVWTDRWVPWIDGFIPTPKEEVYTQQPILVSHLIDPELHCWRHNLVRELFNLTWHKQFFPSLLHLDLSL